ncbi:MAG: CRTAC1 family protein [Verrucomicrobia bacterium]|nr:CRTAC1 family protein [Verrucomicrobiota bacterium]
MRPISRRLLVGLGILAVVGTLALWRRGSPDRSAPRSREAAAEQAARDYLQLEARERAAAEQVWAPELEAARHEDELWRWWDLLKAAPNPWKVLGELPVGQVVLPGLRKAEELGLLSWSFTPGNPAEATPWREVVEIGSSAGWTLGATTWSVVAHDPAQGTRPGRSRVRITAQFEQRPRQLRANLELVASVGWQGGVHPVPLVDQVQVESGELVLRSGPVPFRLWLEDLIPTERSIFADPLLAWDLDGDGVSELILVGADRIWRRTADAAGPGTWRSADWLGLPRERIVAALRVDVNGDQWDDLVLADSTGVRWWSGGVQGPSVGAPHVGWMAPVPLKHPQVMTAGDIDGDGDLDLWVAQYKLPYQGGQFPTPWDDANDGFPSYLLRNEGDGRFSDITEGSGLAAKRFRRSYSASWIDLDLDGDLDLVNISDFAGLDVYQNQGRGTFVDVTPSLGSARHAFGMSHVVGDLNHDGRPDLLMLGMTSAVADRLGYLGLERGEGDLTRIREMTVGNRLYWGALGAAGLVPAPASWSAAVARTGWTWGAAWADFDLDGALDLAVANGHETRASVRDYERQFWWHDRFVADSRNHPVADLYFRTASGRRQADQASYGGWQSNVLLRNQGPRRWLDLAWLWGVAELADCRNLLAEDLDRDGRIDLIVTTQEEWPVRRQRLLVFRNELPPGNWSGIQWSGPYPTGGRLELKTSTGRQSHWFLTGDGFRSQGSASVVLGLGPAEPIDLKVIPIGHPVRNVTGIHSREWKSVSRQ